MVKLKRMPKARHIAVYVRGSSKLRGLRSQVPDLKQWLSAYAGELPVQWYRDKGKAAQQGWEALETEVHAGRVERIVVWRIDRLGRTPRGLVSLFEELGRFGVGLTSLRDGLDLSTPEGRLLAQIILRIFSGVGLTKQEVQG